MPGADWDPAAYARFRGLRLRPAMDLLAAVPDLPAGDVIDLGCGNGAAAGALRGRFPGRRLVGVDASPAMLAAAEGYDATVQADIAEWQPEIPPALIFSNAALHWLDDHGALFPRLARVLAPGGVLAVQMPRQFDAPSHRLLREVAARLFTDRFDCSDWRAPVAPPPGYWPLLSPLGRADIWETEYLQHLAPVAEGHPVRAFTLSTAARPVLARLDTAEQATFLSTYDTALHDAYPLLTDGSALMPFRRLFLVLERPANVPGAASPSHSLAHGGGSA
ncbi:MAG TPA: methyltransferase domain-containing protein [Paracoccaceae bacterium]|nr:methyltransferase domain-containing protein [Paracoccaceae bacterium]